MPPQLRARIAIAVIAAAVAGAGWWVQRLAGGAVAVTPARIDRAIAASWTGVPADWQPRFRQDETMRACSAARAGPDAALQKAVAERERAAIRYPADGGLVGDWKRGEALAQSGYGLRFTDTDAARANGGNCYACHKLDPAEVSFGTVGPSLEGYGRNRRFQEADARAVYEKIYNPHASHPCSAMPRFGAAGVLTIDQIRDLVALLMDPSSPVNR